MTSELRFGSWNYPQSFVRMGGFPAFMNPIVLETFLIFFHLLANGVFAMTEIAIVSSRKSRLQAMANRGSTGAAKALQLAESPNRFLSTIQIGITLVGIVAGAIGSRSITTSLAKVIATFPRLADDAPQIALVIIIGALTYLSRGSSANWYPSDWR